MTLTYPLKMPSTPAPAEASIYIERNQTAVEGFSRQKQIHRNPGDRWVGKVTLPPMDRQTAQNWLGFFDALDGFVGSFTMPHPDYTTPTGSALGAGTVSGAGQTGTRLMTSGWGASQPLLFRRGDMVEVSGKLRRVVEDTASDGAGLAELTLMPALLTAPPDATSIVTASPEGIFSLSEGFVAPSSDALGTHSFSFAIEEVLP